MRPYVTLEKKIGETPLQALSRWKEANPEYAAVPASYAGRLDPMASGTLLVLLGEECKKQKDYTKLDKEYEVEVLLDIGSDTGDALGLVEYVGREMRIAPKVLRSVLDAELGAHLREYPAYSSKPVEGKPLFLHALEGTLNRIDIPKHIERIHRIELTGTYTLPKQEFADGVAQYLARVPRSVEESKELGRDFRIEKVTESWKQAFDEMPERSFFVLRLRVVCGSGTYMRGLAQRLGEKLLTKAIALSIHRTKIGNYVKGVWVKRY